LIKVQGRDNCIASAIRTTTLFRASFGPLPQSKYAGAPYGFALRYFASG